MAGRSSLAKHYSSKPPSTLAFTETEDDNVKTATERERKTEKSVHFASEDETVSDDQSVSQDFLSWIPSEHLYSEDTFISESQTYQTVRGTAGSDDVVTTIETGHSYGTDTFIESEDETRTASDFSYSESVASSEIFSPSPKSQSDSATYREWKDVTEIVKDIEELEESEFVTKADSLHLVEDEDQETDFTESEDEEMAEMAKQDFLLNTIRFLKLRELQSPRSLAAESCVDSVSDEPPRVVEPDEPEKAMFCKKMIQRCRKNRKNPSPRRAASSQLHEQATESKEKVLEHYGLTSSIVDRLKVENLQHRLEKKKWELDKETENSLEFVKNNQHIEEEFRKREFISQMQAHVQNEQTEERIQAHLIRMHPVTWFSYFINDLPKIDENSREILYKYKRQVEKRIQDEHG